MPAKDTIVLHHTADPSPDPQFAKVNRSHKDRGFPKSKLGFYVGYHFFLGKDGTTKQARGEDEIGAHAVNCGCAGDLSGYRAGTINSYSFGICLAGDFTKQLPTKNQIRSLTLLVLDLQTRYAIRDSRIFLHGEVKSTSCPGCDLRAYYLQERVVVWREQAEALRKRIERAQGIGKSVLQRRLARLEEKLP